MDKTNYFRKIIFTGDDVKELLKIIPDWLYTEEKYDGLNRITLTNKMNKVKIIFHNDQGFYQSVNVMPTDGSSKYDFSDNPEKDITKDILYSLWLLINQISLNNSMDIACGLVPSNYDCGAKKYEL